MLTTILVTTTVFTLLYAFYVGGRLKQTEDKVEVLRAALHRHLETGEDFRTTARLALETQNATTKEFLRLVGKRDDA